jgi:uncharacterized protein (TIGR02996 family)
MSDRAALIAAILQHPDEDTPRLAFADWLQEHAETLPAKERDHVTARAEFIRSQIEAARLPEEKRESSKPGKRAAALAEKYEWSAWRRALGEFPYGRYVRGFLVGIEEHSANFTTRGADILAQEPAQFTLRMDERLDWSDTPTTLSKVKVFANNPFLRAVTAIETNAGGSEFGAKRYIQLFKSPYLVNLKRLDIFADPIGLAGVKAVVAASAPFRLETLRLSGVFQDPEVDAKATVEAVKLISSAVRFAPLKELGLQSNGLGAESIEALLASKNLPSDLSLDLTDNPYSGRIYSRQLAERFGSVVE